MKLHVPQELVENVVCKDEFGPLKEDSGTTYSFGAAHLEQCTANGIDQMICIPSGGGKKFEVAYLDYSQMISPGTKHVRCVFVKPEDVQEYRSRYANLILVELPDRTDIKDLGQIAHVGDARLWILAFVTQLRLHAERCANHSAAAAFFARCFMLDDDVICLHELKPKGDFDVPCTLNAMLRAIRCKTRKPNPPALVGFHCQRRQGSQRSELWTADDQLGTALATALSVSTAEGVPQFHPYAELGEDVGFDQALRLVKTQEGELRFDVAALKCNFFGYTRVNSGDTHGANREATPFACELVKKFKEVGFDPAVRIDHTGTYPLLKAIHAWSWQKVTLPGENEVAFKNTHFLYTRPDDAHMEHLRDASIRQGVFIWLTEKDLPHCEARITLQDAFALFLRKLKGPGLLVATAADFDSKLSADVACSRLSDLSYAQLKLPWCNQSTEYRLYKVEQAAAQQPAPVFWSLHRGQRTLVDLPL